MTHFDRENNKEVAMLDTTALRTACCDLLDAAAAVADADTPVAALDGEWTADQILAHVSIVNANTIAAA